MISNTFNVDFAHILALNIKDVLKNTPKKVSKSLYFKLFSRIYQ